MQIIVPDYYKEFLCIADRCRHSCCIGWEIDIDEESLARYDTWEGEYGAVLRARIDRSGETPYFKLGEGERCPFLRPDGLCEMILELGEDALCQICADHPRFRNYYSDRIELGLGLCCEAAGALILKRRKPMKLELQLDNGVKESADSEEETLLSFREMLFSILQDRSCTLDERMEELLDTCGASLPEGGLSAWVDFLLGLERLDEGWTQVLLELKKREKRVPLVGAEWETAFEQAAVYFLYRHLREALVDGDVATKAAFAVFSVELLRALCAGKKNVTLDDLVEFARMYSGEIEYSEENLWAVFDWLGSKMICEMGELP